MARLSVVLPVYNVERYLAACLESLRTQTVRDLEIICVDDGSTDRSAILLGMAEAVDPRIVVVRKPNGGLSSARNAGLAVASGEFVLFVDSDDFLDRRAVETILGTFDATQAEVVTFGARVQPASLTNPWLERTLSPRSVTYEGFQPALLFGEASRPFVWRSAFSRAFLEREGLLFDESVAFGEDQVFYFAAYPVSRRTVLIPDKLYHYRVSRPDSLMASRFRDRRTMMTEHHHITRVILQQWRDRGWLETHRGPMLEWVFEFLSDEAVDGEPTLARDLRVSLAALLGEFFPAGAWLDHLGPAARHLREAFLDPGAVDGPASLKAFHAAWQGPAHPRSLARRLMGRAANTRPGRASRAVARRVRALAGGDQDQRVDDLREEIEDNAQRARALQLLLVEWLAAVPTSVEASATLTHLEDLNP